MVRVISIIGYTRSGSTLLDSVLGELDGVFSAGELHYLWERGLLERRTCGCGRRVVDCEVWSAVLDLSFRGRAPEPQRVVDWQSRTVRTRHTPALLAGGKGPIDTLALRAYSETLSAVYSAIAQVTGCETVVDSSKRPSDGALTMLLDGVEATIVHLVRDPRAVAFSWRRMKRELDHPNASHMPQRSVLTSATGWVGLNLAAEAVRGKASDRGMLVRYEDLTAQPRDTVVTIASMVGASTKDLRFIGANEVVLGENHTVSGNPGRFRRGAVSLVADEEWRERMNIHDRLVTTLIASPLLPRYRYPLFPARSVGPVDGSAL